MITINGLLTSRVENRLNLNLNFYCIKALIISLPKALLNSMTAQNNFKVISMQISSDQFIAR